MDLGNKICKIRKDNNLTQEEFAERYNVTRQTVSSWENCKSYPDLDTLVRISDDFSISLDVLLKEDKKVIKDIDKNVKKIDKDMLVTDIFNLIYDSPTPLAVVENDRLIGVVIRGSVIEALAETDSAAQAEEGVVTNG